MRMHSFQFEIQALRKISFFFHANAWHEGRNRMLNSFFSPLMLSIVFVLYITYMYVGAAAFLLLFQFGTVAKMKFDAIESGE